MKVSKKVYYKIKFKLTSPLALSSGENNYSDKDVIRDATGKPYIPASSIAGVCRNEIDKECASNYFGTVVKADADNSKVEAIESSLLFYDAYMPAGTKYTVTLRDGVGLDEYKTAIDGAKYDMEVLEPGVIFITYIEQNISDEKDNNIAGVLAKILKSDRLCFGGKTMRGYGSIHVFDVYEKSFDLNSDIDVRNWISFDMYNDDPGTRNAYREIPGDEKSEIKEMTLSLKQTSGISIRKYTTRPAKDKNHPEPDYEQLTLIGENAIPVIPGTSWAGAFGHQMKTLGLSEADYKDLFGYVTGKDTSKSRIRFSETQLSDTVSKKMSRTAIDRFSGGAVDEALFTDRTYYKGRTDLTITVKGNMNASQINTFAATVADLNNGFLAVGGLTSIGRGMFSVEKINGDSVKDDEVYTQVLRLLSDLEVKE